MKFFSPINSNDAVELQLLDYAFKVNFPTLQYFYIAWQSILGYLFDLAFVLVIQFLCDKRFLLDFSFFFCYSQSFHCLNFLTPYHH